MLNVVNNDLFIFQTEAGKNKYGDFFKTKVLPNVPVKDNVEHRIVTIVSNSKNYNDYPMQLSSGKTEGGGLNVLLKSFENNRFDMQLYLVAFPFNGLADAIPKSNEYRIHRGYLYTSKTRTVKFGDSTYKKVLYLLVEPNVRLFDPNNANHTDSISLDFVSYNIENVEGSDERQTFKETVTLTMYPKDAAKQYDISWNRNAVEPIDKESLKDIDLYTIYERKDRVPASEDHVAKLANKLNKSTQKKTAPATNDNKYKKQSGEMIEKLGYRTATTRNNSRFETKAHDYEDHDKYPKKPGKSNKGKNKTR